MILHLSGTDLSGTDLVGVSATATALYVLSESRVFQASTTEVLDGVTFVGSKKVAA